MVTTPTPARVAGLTVVSLALGLGWLAVPAAQAAPVPVPPAVTATTSVDTAAATIVGGALPLLGVALSAADLDLGDVSGRVAGSGARTSAHAANLSADAVGIPLGGILSSADQSAPADNPATATATTVPTIAVPPVLSAGVSDSAAQARWGADGSCLPAGTALSTSTTSTADARILDLPVVGALLGIPGTVSTTQSVTLAATGGAGDARQVVAETGSDLVAADLFGSVGIGVSEAPRLVATASGVSPATVSYNQPVVTVTVPGRSPLVLDVANETVSFALPENPLLELELGLGAVERSTALDGTSATGSAALLHVRLSLAGLDIARVDLVPMRVAATAPAGGVTCAAPAPAPSPAPADPDTTPPAVPVITAPAPGSSTPDSTPEVSGTGAEPGSTVTVRDKDGAIVCRDTTVAADTRWSCTPTRPLAPGAHTLTVTVTDPAGNTSGPARTSFTVTVPGTTPGPDPDRDGLSTPEEKALGTDPQRADSDTDGLKDGREVRGIRIKERFEVCGRKARTSIRVTTDPLERDTDGDRLSDGREVTGYVIKQKVVFTRAGGSFRIGRTRSNPTKADTDRDKLSDRQEMTGARNTRHGRAKTDPTKCDTDRGGASDGREVRRGSDPTRIKSGPNDTASPLRARARRD